jgi:hypothetical protein
MPEPRSTAMRPRKAPPLAVVALKPGPEIDPRLMVTRFTAIWRLGLRLVRRRLVLRGMAAV